MPLAERLLAALMIGSQLLAWLALTFIGVKTVVYTAAFYWCWALKNILLGPLTTDLGVITFGLVSLSILPRLSTALFFRHLDS